MTNHTLSVENPGPKMLVTIGRLGQDITDQDHPWVLFLGKRSDSGAWGRKTADLAGDDALKQGSMFAPA